MGVEDGSTANGFTSDQVAAIDQAVADGVDVINYSISGTTTNFRDPVEIAFMYAADAGVFVAASAGNSGPTTGTVAHPSPWITSVAAGTHNRSSIVTATLGNGSTYTGAVLDDGRHHGAPDRLDGRGLAGASASAVSLCFSTSGMAALRRSTRPRWPARLWSATAATATASTRASPWQEAGGVGMILLNTDLHFAQCRFPRVPTAHLQNTACAP